MLEILKIATNTHHMKDPFSNDEVELRNGRYSRWQKEGLLIFAIAIIFSLGIALVFFIGSAYFKHKKVESVQDQNISSRSDPVQNESDPAKSEAAQSPLRKIIGEVPPIQKDFTKALSIEKQRAAHEKAKEFLKVHLPEIGATVDFFSHTIKDAPKLEDIVIKEKLDSTVFTQENTKDVGENIKKDGRRAEDNIIVYGAASQFNGCEAPKKETIPPGNAERVYKTDKTQGPAAQLAFSPEQVELINCGGNLGLNALCKLLDEDTISEVAHGYFTPNQSKAEKIIQRLRERGDLIEYPCIANKPIGGEKDVHLFLVSAAAFGMYANSQSVKGKERDEIQFLCALHGFRAQFEKCIKLAQTQGKPVIFKATAVGLGVFGNNPTIVAKAFYRAALDYQAYLKEHKVAVVLQVMGAGKAAQMASELKLEPR